ncbi:MAG TPA: F0F1 ATP synthase subunit epsilon [Acidimicrobiales bacterium]|nr:F0F1 ATP synthase subunit epsilon [Acidimicrobiales bacterium]
MTMTVQVVSPERILWSGEAEMVTARTIEGGDISFQTGHAPFVGALQTGKVTIRPGDADPIVFAVHGGFVEVSNDEVSLLSDVSEAADQIDVERAQAALANARSALATDPLDAAAVDAVRRAEIRLDVAGAVAA